MKTIFKVLLVSTMFFASSLHADYTATESSIESEVLSRMDKTLFSLDSVDYSSNWWNHLSICDGWVNISFSISKNMPFGGYYKYKNCCYIDGFSVGILGWKLDNCELSVDFGPGYKDCDETNNYCSIKWPIEPPVNLYHTI